MRLIGLTGGIATGKSTFAAALRERGVPVIDADVLARQVVARGTPGLAQVVAAFGPEVLGPAGELDRKKLAARVFGDPAARAALEAITHPAIREALQAETRRLDAAGAPLAFYDVPLLYEVGLEEVLDCVVVVYAPAASQLLRLERRDGLTYAEAKARLAAQLPIDEKARRADVLVTNEADPAALRAKAEPLLRDLSLGLSRKLPNAPPKRY
ncbi:dephospho-CoA kinase [Anaeromyxobacter paludicola]|uniref:Dephospho-CoA kinase n=1 Tax=Anaeromyxobacter paludicola TaxID=2918171 RepID=A0ABM7X8U1_9BACT|nr:dephospho-CoA kinase [Anaeromyxobacter paludicola]BDG08243.1 dephospho-CoA kinase [Anaeromyxobacter paludicola]